MLLNVVQSAALSAPRFVAEAVGTFNVITGVVVLFATVELKSVPVVPSVKAATEVTVPPVPVALIVIAAEPLYVVPVLNETPVPAVRLNRLPPRLTPEIVLFDSWLLAILPSVPPSVRLPELVTVPVSVMPLTVPVPLTDVTVPPLDGDVLLIVKLGYVPLVEIPVPPVSVTI